MKKIVSFMLVLILSFGTVASVCAQENVVSQPRLTVGIPTIPAGYGAEWGRAQYNVMQRNA